MKLTSFNIDVVIVTPEVWLKGTVITLVENKKSCYALTVTAIDRSIEFCICPAFILSYLVFFPFPSFPSPFLTFKLRDCH